MRGNNSCNQTANKKYNNNTTPKKNNETKNKNETKYNQRAKEVNVMNGE